MSARSCSCIPFCYCNKGSSVSCQYNVLVMPATCVIYPGSTLCKSQYSFLLLPGVVYNLKLQITCYVNFLSWFSLQPDLYYALLAASFQHIQLPKRASTRHQCIRQPLRITSCKTVGALCAPEGRRVTSCSQH